MPYFFRCDYCNDETDIQPWDIGDLSRNCDDCGQDMCIKCYGRQMASAINVRGMS